ncbi:MFS transporter [Ensifer sp. HO-A22]|uniref:MFS transporter n=1 Tax=Ensifer oleiphilus TaxID=2742698 RepID=A0A7Y6UPD6_9HYPH|nr:MFS transporter [Ensifer oleiphilus]NVD40949.1 MFS transporter [Ensifer oleiphilus]
MANPYGQIFAVPGTTAFTLAGLVSRLPLSMMAIGIITMLAQARGSYGLAGGVAAAFTLALALVAPQVSRLVDRFGQGRVLPVAAALSIAGTAGLLIATHWRAPDWTLFVFALIAGSAPSMSAMTRARWSEIYRGRPELKTAFSLESVFDEVCFIVGPPIAVGLSVGLFPEAGPLAAAIFLAIGVTAFVLQKGTEPSVRPPETIATGSALRYPAPHVLILALAGMGVIVGTIDVVSVAFAEAEGQPAAASVVLSLYALGSCIAGLTFGAVRIGLSLPKLFLIGAGMTAASTLPLLLVDGVTSLAAMMFLSGVFFAPTMIVALSMGEIVVPPAKLTEGLTWLTTGLGIGVAAGAASAGAVVARFGVQTGFAIAVAAGVLILVAALAGYRRLSRIDAAHAVKADVATDSRAGVGA